MAERGLVTTSGLVGNATGIFPNHEVPFGRFPYHGVSDNGLCACTLIHEDVLVSAAHCAVLFRPGRSTNIHLGGIERDGGDAPETMRVERTMVHPDYNNITQGNDIMLIKLESSSVLPVAAWNHHEDESRYDVSATDTLIVIGYGDTFYDGPASTVLLGVVVPFVDHDTCNGRQAYNGEIIEKLMICAGAEGIDACQGTSIELLRLPRCTISTCSNHH
jgi:secreted trypsin-like serine protease